MAVIDTMLIIAGAALAGAISGALAARWLVRRNVRRRPTAPYDPPDPAFSAEIDRAASAWANAQGRPEATGLVADKLHLIHGIGARRGWWK